MYSEDEKEDFCFDFTLENSEKIDLIEGDMVEATKQSDYDNFMTAWHSMKELCEAGGVGGITYFEAFYKSDPRIRTLQIIKDGPVYEDVISMLNECGPSESREIYLLATGSSYEVLRKLVRNNEVLRIPDSHIYYLPNQDISEVTQQLRKSETRSQVIEREFAGEHETVLETPSSDSLLNTLDRLESELDIAKKRKNNNLFSLIGKLLYKQK